jgi:putative acetyltransferase
VLRWFTPAVEMALCGHATSASAHARRPGGLMVIAPASDLDEVRNLFREYAEWTAVDLSFQGFEQELATLESFYVAIFVARVVPSEVEGSPAEARVSSPIRGSLDFVRDDTRDDTPHDLAGCIALRHLDDQLCEMKRLYVRPAFRGRNLGRKLAEHVIDEARTRGYKAMRLDTLPNMQQAMALYESLGFRDIEPYRYNPVARSRFLELTL